MPVPWPTKLPSFADIKTQLPTIVYPRNLIALVLLSPIALLIVGDPQSFTLAWGWEGQVGRGSFLFLAFIVIWEWLDSRKDLPVSSSKKRVILSVAIFAAVIGYYTVRVLSPEFRADLYNFGYSVGAGKGTDSFPLAIDYIAYLILAFLETVVLLGPGGFKAITTPVVYSVGTLALVLLDAFFPYDSLGFMQTWVGIVWGLVLGVLTLVGVRIAKIPSDIFYPPAVYLSGNKLFTFGSKGFMTIIIYWPSSGLVSMVIFSIVIAVIIIKMDMPVRRKAIYAAIGALGTFLVNVIRISMIVLYVMFVSLDVKAFHDVIGEILFVIWIVIYILAIVRFEDRYIPPAATAAAATKTSRTSQKK